MDEKRGRHGRMSEKQKLFLVDFLLEHPHLAIREQNVSVSPVKARRELVIGWTKLTHLLNSMGESKKSNRLWRRSWTKLKAAVKARAATLRRHLDDGEGEPPNEILLSEVDAKVLSLVKEENTSIEGTVQHDPDTIQSRSEDDDGVQENPELWNSTNDHCYGERRGKLWGDVNEFVGRPISESSLSKRGAKRRKPCDESSESSNSEHASELLHQADMARGQASPNVGSASTKKNIPQCAAALVEAILSKMDDAQQLVAIKSVMDVLLR